MLAELESESHRGAAPAKPQSSRPFVPTPTPVACPVAEVAKPPPPMPVVSPGAVAAKLVFPRKRERVPVDMDCVAFWNLSLRMHGGQSARFDVLPVEVSTPARTRSGEVTGDAQGRCQGD